MFRLSFIFFTISSICALAQTPPNYEKINSISFNGPIVNLEINSNHNSWSIEARNKNNFLNTKIIINGVELSNNFETVYENKNNKNNISLIVQCVGTRKDKSYIIKEKYDNKINLSLYNILFINNSNIEFKIINNSNIIKEADIFNFILKRLNGPLIYRGDDITEAISVRYAKWLREHPKKIDNAYDILSLAIEICKIDRRNSPCEHAFIIADEMNNYRKNYRNGRFASGISRALKIISIESSFCYWSKNKMSSASGIWQFLDSTSNNFGMSQIRDVKETLERVNYNKPAMERIGGLSNALWINGPHSIHQLMRPHPGENGMPDINSNRSEAFSILFNNRKIAGVSNEKAFELAVEDAIRFQVNMGCRLLDNSGWRQWSANDLI